MDEQLFTLHHSKSPIGIFDSGYGGLTILNQVRQLLPQYDYLYLGDNARAPYGARSFDVVYEFTRQAVVKLFEMGCQLVILGCNTASAKALRTIQQHDLPKIDSSRRVLGIIRPTAEIIGTLTKTRHVGILATEGTIKSKSYNLEIQKLWPDIQVSGVACPLWAAIVEANEADSLGADYFVEKRINQLLTIDAQIDTIILGCTHYPLLLRAMPLSHHRKLGQFQGNCSFVFTRKHSGRNHHTRLDILASSCIQISLNNIIAKLQRLSQFGLWRYVNSACTIRYFFT